jgi:hypothetical protein
MSATRGRSHADAEVSQPGLGLRARRVLGAQGVNCDENTGGP